MNLDLFYILIQDLSLINQNVGWMVNRYESNIPKIEASVVKSIVEHGLFIGKPLHYECRDLLAQKKDSCWL